MISITEKWQGGVMLEHTEKDDGIPSIQEVDDRVKALELKPLV